MRDFLLLIAIGVAAYLAYDDYSKRSALKSAQAEIQRLNTERSQAAAAPTRQNPTAGRARSYAPAPSSAPAWFQDRLNERPSLDAAERHKQKEQDTSRPTQYGSRPSPSPQ
jgi:Tfp pilus assembly major pilin PilA